MWPEATRENRNYLNGLQPEPTGGFSPKGNPRPREGRGLHELTLLLADQGRYARMPDNYGTQPAKSAGRGPRNSQSFALDGVRFAGEK